MDTEKIKSFWNDVATSSEHKDKKNSGMLGPGTKFFEDYRIIQEEKVFNELIDITKIKNVLEVGCGGGRWSFYLSDKVNFVKGIDISSEMINLSKKNAEEQNIKNVDFEEIDFLDLSEDVKYDLVYFSGVLQYIDDGSIKKIAEKLKTIINQDSIVLSRDTMQSAKRVVKNGNYPVTYRTMDEYIGLFKSQNFALRENILAYKMPRFTRVLSMFYTLPFFSLNFTLFIGSILGGINNLLGNPKFLMNKGLIKTIESGNTQDHIFTIYKIEG
jgi:ubiquinone/menaquinone biosynthesis C-methylase UbiE